IPDFPKQKSPKFNFNFYWVYALVIFVIIAVNFFDFGNRPHETTWNDFVTYMVKTNDVDKVIVVNKSDVNVYIKKESLKKDYFKKIARKTFGSGLNEGPHYTFTIGDVGSFKKELDEAQKDIPEDQRINVIYSNNE